MITDEYSDVGVSKNSTSGDGATWGLASLGLGAVVLLAAPITLVFNVLLWRSNPSADLPIVPAILGAALGLLVMLGLARCSIMFGMKGRRIDREDRRSSPLAAEGILVGAAATIVWTMVGIDLFAILSSFR
jgi:hypothetical protein